MSKLIDGDTVLTAAGTIVMGAKGFSLPAAIVTGLVGNIVASFIAKQFPDQFPRGSGADPEVTRFFANLAASAGGWWVGHAAAEDLHNVIHDPNLIGRLPTPRR